MTDITNKLNELNRNVDDIKKRLTDLSRESERQNEQLAQAVRQTHSLLDRVQDDITRLQRDVQTTYPGGGVGHVAQPQGSNFDVERIAWAISQSVQQAVSGTLRQVFSGPFQQGAGTTGPRPPAAMG